MLCSMIPRELYHEVSEDIIVSKHLDGFPFRPRYTDEPEHSSPSDPTALALAHFPPAARTHQAQTATLNATRRINSLNISQSSKT